MFAVIRTGGKQYRVAKDDTIVVERLPAEPGAMVEIADVLMIGGDGKAPRIGHPVLDKAAVFAEVVEQSRGDKIIVFKKKRRKDYRRTRGHRQEQTVLRILDVSPTGAKPKAPAKAKAKPPKKAEPKPAPKAEAEERAPAKETAEAKKSEAKKAPAKKKPAAKKAAPKKPAAKKKAEPKKAPPKKAAPKKATAEKTGAKKKPAAKKKAQPKGKAKAKE